MLHRSSKNGGFTMVEILMTVSIMGFVLLATTNLLGAIFKSSRDARITSEVNSTLDRVKSAVASRQDCTLNIAGTNLITSDGTGTTVANGKLSLFDSAKNPATTVAALSTGNGDMVIRDMKLVPVQQISASKYLGNLALIVEKKDVIGAVTVVRNVPLKMDIGADGKVTSCIGSPTAEVNLNGLQTAVPTPLPAATPAEPMNDIVTVCRVASGGAMAVDPVTGYCIPVVAQPFPGTETEASCPAGWKLPNPNDPDFCEAVEPSGRDDDDWLAPREMEDGSYMDAPPVFTSTVPSTNTCKCIFAVGINKNGWKCVAMCVPK